MKARIILILFIIGILAVSYFGTAGLVWLVCWAFDKVFSFKAATAIWVLWLVISLSFNKKGGI